MACYKVPLSGPVGTPVSGGVAIVSIVSPDFSVSARGNPISRDKSRKTKEFKESGDVTPTALFLLHPPFCPCNKKHAVVCNMKNTPDLAPQTGSENRVARNVE